MSGDNRSPRSFDAPEDDEVVGLRSRLTRVVGRADTAEAFGNPGVQVLGSPRLIAWFEDAAAAAFKPALPFGFHSVGIRVELHHLAATPIGGSVELEAEIVGYDGRRVEFRIEAWAGRTLVGRGTHTRAVVESRRFHRGALERQSPIG